jgi:hypothetical protein
MQRELGRFLPGFRFIGGRVPGEVCLRGGVHTRWIDPP